MSWSSWIVELIFLFVFSCFLTCSVSTPNYVSYLPGFHGTFPSRLETGYITVDEAKSTEFFYYFIESESEPSKDPILLWLTGGPGCSSFYGFSQETGAIAFKVEPYDGILPQLFYNPNSWTKISSIIYLDWPSGTGFSYSRRNADIVLADVESLNQIYKFLQQWFLDHPEFLSNTFYVAGDSYGGKLAALVAHRVAKGIEAAEQPIINLEGFLIGNPRTGVDKFDINSRVPRAHALGIISDEIFESIQICCVGEDYYHPKNEFCVEKLKVFDKFVDELWINNILTPTCQTGATKGRQMRGARLSLLEENFPKLLLPPPPTDIKCPEYINFLAYYWENNNFTRMMLGVKKGTVEEWNYCNSSLKERYTEDIPSSLPYIYDLLTRGYRALVYSGDHDLNIPYIGTMEWIESFNLPVVDKWRSWHFNGQVAGYTQAYSRNLTFATVLGAGHEAVADKPMQCWAMFERWITHKPL